MSLTFYDLLEVSQTASLESIAAAYKRLHTLAVQASDTGDEDSTNRLVALREAYNTLANPERRQKYDLRLAGRQAAQQQPSPMERPRSYFPWLLAAVVILGGGLTYKYWAEEAKARLERERIAAETKQAELAAEKVRADKMALDNAELQRKREESMERSRREQDLAYGRQVSRDIQRNEDQIRRDRAREEQMRANAERQEALERERQLARDKAYLRQLEAENSRYRRF